MCKGPNPYLDVVLQNRRVFATEEGGMGIFLFKIIIIIILIVRGEKKLPSKIASLCIYSPPTQYFMISTSS